MNGNCCCRDNGMGDISHGLNCLISGIGKGVCSGINVLTNAGCALGSCFGGAPAANCCAPSCNCRRPRCHEPNCSCGRSNQCCR